MRHPSPREPHFVGSLPWAQVIGEVTVLPADAGVPRGLCADPAAVGSSSPTRGCSFAATGERRPASLPLPMRGVPDDTPLARAAGPSSLPGAVAVDPAPREPLLYFFVPRGSTAQWDVPHTIDLGSAAQVVLPPDHKEAPPGPYWLIPRHHGLTPIDVLRQALGTAR